MESFQPYWILLSLLVRGPSHLVHCICTINYHLKLRLAANVHYCLQGQCEECVSASFHLVSVAVSGLLFVRHWLHLWGLPGGQWKKYLREHLSVSFISQLGAVGDALSLSLPLRVFIAVVFTALSLGRASSFAPDATKAKISATRILSLLDRKPLIDVTNTDGQKMVCLHPNHTPYLLQ